MNLFNRKRKKLRKLKENLLYEPKRNVRIPATQKIYFKIIDEIETEIFKKVNAPIWNNIWNHVIDRTYEKMEVNESS